MNGMRIAEFGLRSGKRGALIAALALGLLFVDGIPSLAGECRVVLQSHAAHHAHAVYAPLALYQVGAALREEAVAERAAALALEKFLARLQAEGPVRPSTLDSGPSALHPPSTLVQRSCVSCHGGASPKAGLDLSDLTRLSADERLRAVGRVVSDDPALRMPPGAPLDPAEIGSVLQELSGSR